MKNNYVIKSILLIIFFIFITIFMMSVTGLFVTGENHFIPDMLVSLGFIGIFLFLKLIHDKIR